MKNKTPTYEPRSLKALRLLLAGPQSYRQLAAQLYICPTYAKQVVRKLRQTRYSIQSAWRGKERIFWATAPAGGLGALLDEVEQLAIERLWQGPPSPLQTAFYKLSRHLLTNPSTP